MEYMIYKISPLGCVMPVCEKNGEIFGAPQLEPGDFERAKELLDDSSYNTVSSVWTKNVISNYKEHVRMKNEEASQLTNNNW